MSGIEVAGLVFGVIPIVVEILKSYGATRDRLKTFLRHAQVVNDVQLRFRVAATNFRNDCHLLLKTVVDDTRQLSEMVKDPTHDGWQDPALEGRFRSFLDRDYELCEEIMVKIRDTLRKTQAKLVKFNRSLTDHRAPANIVAFYQAFNIARKENQYRQWLDDLDHWNSKLGHLRTQRCKLIKRQKYPESCLIRKAVPRKYLDIQVASQRLHESLQDSWSCSNLSHEGHQAKLSLEAKADYGAVRLDMAIACRRRSLPLPQR